MELQLRLPGDWPVGEYRRTAMVPDAEDLESVLSWLQEVEVNAWIQTTPAHIAAAVHPPDGGPDIRRDFQAIGGEWPRGEIARWLLDTVREHYNRIDL